LRTDADDCHKHARCVAKKMHLAAGTSNQSIGTSTIVAPDRPEGDQKFDIKCKSQFREGRFGLRRSVRASRVKSRIANRRPEFPVATETNGANTASTEMPEPRPLNGASEDLQRDEKKASGASSLPSNSAPNHLVRRMEPSASKSPSTPNRDPNPNLSRRLHPCLSCTAACEMRLRPQRLTHPASCAHRLRRAVVNDRNPPSNRALCKRLDSRGRYLAGGAPHLYAGLPGERTMTSFAADDSFRDERSKCSGSANRNGIVHLERQQAAELHNVMTVQALGRPVSSELTVTRLTRQCRLKSRIPITRLVATNTASSRLTAANARCDSDFPPSTVVFRTHI